MWNLELRTLIPSEVKTLEMPVERQEELVSFLQELEIVEAATKRAATRCKGSPKAQLMVKEIILWLS